MTNIIEFAIPETAGFQKAIALFSKETADLALAEFIKLIDSGHDEAFSFAGNLYETGGRNLEKDYSKAKFYYEKSVERIGSVAAYLGLIRIYYYGLGIEKDCCKALEYSTIVADDTKHPYANFYIGKMYMEGCCVDKDVQKSKEYFKRSWEAGYVFGLTYLGLAEQLTGNKFRGWYYRLKAGIYSYWIGRKDINDSRIRQL